MCRRWVALLAVGAVAASCTTQTPTPIVDGGPDAQLEGGVATEAGVCGPNSTTGFVPGQMTSPEGAPRSGQCTQLQVDDYAACQTDTPSLCSQFLPNNPGAGCAACIETKDTAAPWGVLVFTGSQQARFNYGGCIDLALGQVGLEPNSCGELVFESYACQEAACVPCEGQQQINGGDAFSACAALAIASGGTCAAYDAKVQDATGPCAALQDAAPADLGNCFPDLTIADALTRQKDFLKHIVGYFCGPP